MTRRALAPLLAAAAAAAVAALVALALPAAAAAAVGGPYVITGVSGATLSAAPQTAGSALVVQVAQAGASVAFTPAAVAFDPVATGCSNVVTPGKTVCPRPAVSLTLSGSVVEAGVTDLQTGLLAFAGGVANDIFSVGGTATVGTVSVAPGDGADQITVGGNVATFTLVGADPGDDRYDIRTNSIAPAQTLSLGAGNDVVASLAANLRLEGGPGDDTLSGPGDMLGQDGNDLVEPTVTNRIADGGAGIDRLSFDLVDAPLNISKAPAQIVVNGSAKPGFETLEGGTGDDTITGSSDPDVISGGGGNDTIAGGGGADVLDGGPGDNTLSLTAVGAVSVDFNAGTALVGGTVTQFSAFRGVVTGAGADTVVGSPADEHFDLGAGDDNVNGGPGNDTIVAGDGNDLVRGGHGTDVIDGGPGHDTATYDERTVSEPITVTLATPGDDGAPGENDTLTGIEDVVGGASSDVLVGDAGPNLLVGGGGLNTLDGGAGNDTLIGGDFRDVIVGGPGNDTLIGGGDDDSLSAFDGEADTVDCGPSSDDDAQVDGADTVSGCEFASRGDVPVPVDADHDGTVAGFDCDDTNPAIGLAATDIPGDGIDQNCDGFDEPLPLVAGGLRFNYKTSLRGTRITQLQIPDLQRGSTVDVTCKTAIKRRCPFTKATRKPAAAGGTVSLTALFKRRLLPVGTRIEVRITAPGAVGRVRRFTMRPSAAPRAADLCLLPGSTLAKTCPPDVL